MKMKDIPIISLFGDVLYHLGIECHPCRNNDGTAIFLYVDKHWVKIECEDEYENVEERDEK